MLLAFQGLNHLTLMMGAIIGDPSGETVEMKLTFRDGGIMVAIIVELDQVLGQFLGAVAARLDDIAAYAVI